MNNIIKYIAVYKIFAKLIYFLISLGIVGLIYIILKSIFHSIVDES